jgi:hypothetical protein
MPNPKPPNEPAYFVSQHPSSIQALLALHPFVEAIFRFETPS